MTKKEARSLLNKRQRELDGATLRETDAALTERFLALPEYAAALTVMAYCSVGTEPDTGELLQRVLSDGKTLCLPLVTGPGIMEARRVASLAELVPGAFGIPEPPENSEPVPPEELDLILVPGAGFDGEKHRLGKGGGFYDRYLPLTRAFTVALARESMVLDHVPAEAHDVPVACVVTEKRVIR